MNLAKRCSPDAYSRHSCRGVFFIRPETGLVYVNSRDLPQVGLLVHDRLSHKQDDGLLVRHRCNSPHACSKV